MGDTLTRTLCTLLCVKSGQVYAVEDFEQSYVSICKLATAAAKSLDDDLLARARVSNVQLMKERDGPEHEYLLIHITVDGQPKDIAPLGVIRCERTVASQLRAKKRFRAFAVSSLSSSSSPFRSLKHSPALDHATVYDPHDPSQTSSGDRLVYEYDFPIMRTPPPTRLLAAASILHHCFPQYILLQRQCYWYAGMVFRMLIGIDADTLCPTVHTEHVQFAIAYPTALEGKGLETTSTKPNAAEKAVQVSAGTFGTIFKLVTEKDLEKCYTSMADAFKTRFTQIDNELAQVREHAKQQMDELAAMRKENEELKAAARRLDPERDQHLTAMLRLPLSDSSPSPARSCTPAMSANRHTYTRACTR